MLSLESCYFLWENLEVRKLKMVAIFEMEVMLMQVSNQIYRREMPVCQHLKQFKSYLALVCLPLL